VVERFEGMQGNDTIDGRGGIDRVEYTRSNFTSGVIVNLETGLAEDGFGNGGTDTLIGIEDVLGSRLDDGLTGNAGANWLNGSDGDDYLFGGGGNDILVGGIEMDTFVWRAGDQGTESAPAVDTITDFDMSASGDKLDLRDILVGEHSDAAILGNFLDIGSSGGDTTISVRTQGLLGGVDQQKIDSAVPRRCQFV
jgi:Ca2+-binding RTX toxin-like protein